MTRRMNVLHHYWTRVLSSYELTPAQIAAECCKNYEKVAAVRSFVSKKELQLEKGGDFVELFDTVEFKRNMRLQALQMQKLLIKQSRKQLEKQLKQC